MGKKISVPSGQAAPTTTPASGPLTVDTSVTRAYVDQLVRLKGEQERVQAQLDQVRASLDPLVSSARDNAESAGQFTKSLQVKGTTCNARYTYADRYSAIDPSARGDLQTLCGAHYVTLFQDRQSVKVRDGERLVKLLADMGVTPGDYLTIESTIAPCEDFRRVRATIRKDLSPTTNDALDTVIEQIAAKPSVSIK